MTKKEAIKILEFTLPEVYDQAYYDYEEYSFEKYEYDALELAFETLKKTQWIPFKKRELTEEEARYYKDLMCYDICYMMDCECPDDGQEILVSNGKYVWQDVWCTDDGCYLESDHDIEGCAWMPIPEVWEGEQNEQ